MIGRPSHRPDSAAPVYGEAIRTAHRASRIVALAFALWSIPRLAAAQRAATPDDFPGITLCEGGRAVSRIREDVSDTLLRAQLEAHEAVHRAQAAAYPTCEAFMAALTTARQIIDVELPAYCAQWRVAVDQGAEPVETRRDFAWRIAAQSGAMENRLQVVQRFERECELVPPPEARDILFQAQRPGGTEDIYALRIRDSSIRRIVRADTFSSRSLPTWSPNGRSIAFTREFGDTAQLYILDSLSGTPRHIAMGLRGFIAFPDWSPDGSQLLFSAGTHDHYGVYLIQADGTGLRVVLQDTVTYRSPSWSPRGDEFAVSTYRNGRSEILIVNLGTGASRTVWSPDSAYADFPQWSPQGNELLITVYRGTAGLYETRRRKYGSNLALLDLRTLRFRAITDGYGLNNYGRWSRDGRWIVFQSNRYDGELPDSTEDDSPRVETLEVYVVRADGTGLQRLTTNTYFDGHPSW